MNQIKIESAPAQKIEVWPGTPRNSACSINTLAELKIEEICLVAGGPEGEVGSGVVPT